MLERLCAHYEESTGWGVGRRCWGNVELCWQKWGWAALLQRVQGELFIIMAQAMPSDVDNLGGRWWSTLHFPPPFQSLTSLTLECNLRCLVLPLQRRLRQTWHHLFSHQRFNIHAFNVNCIKVFNNISSLRDTLPWCLWQAWQQVRARRQPAQWRQTNLMQPVCKMRNLC